MAACNGYFCIFTVAKRKSGISRSLIKKSKDLKHSKSLGIVACILFITPSAPLRIGFIPLVPLKGRQCFLNCFRPRSLLHLSKCRMT